MNLQIDVKLITIHKTMTSCIPPNKMNFRFF